MISCRPSPGPRVSQHPAFLPSVSMSRSSSAIIIVVSGDNMARNIHFHLKRQICNNHIVDVNVCTISPHLEWIDSPAESELFMSFARVMCNVVLVYCLSYEMTLFIPSSFILY